VLFTFGALIASQAQTWHYARMFSKEAFSLVPKPADFIDQNTNQDVGMIITSTDDPVSYFTTEFWNNRVVRVFATDAQPIASPIMYSPRCEFDWAKDGQILGTGCDEVPDAWYLRSGNVVMHLKGETKRVHPSKFWPEMTLMVGTPPARMLSMIDGRAVRTGVVNGALNARTFLDGNGQMRVGVRGGNGSVVVSSDKSSMTVSPGSTRTLTFNVPAEEHVSTITLKTPSGLQSTAQVTSLEVREPGGRWQSIL
jgi:hypothetical protein